jgi:hypothetical protein
VEANACYIINQKPKHMKNILTLAAVLGLATLAHSQISTPPGGGSQRSVVRQYLGAIPYVEITYNSPAVTGPNGQSRKGKIWGELVPYGLNNLGFGISTADNPSPWRGGADMNTTIEFSHDVTVQGEPIKAGKYGFHLIPAETGPWTLIFSSDNNHWGSYFYQAKNDVLRVETTPQPSAFTEYLTYEFINRKETTATVALKWEELMIPFTIAVPNSKQIHLAQIESEMNNNIGFNYKNLIAGANYALSIGENEKALTWANKAINEPFFGRKTFESLSTKAAVLNAMGRSAEYQALMDEAVKMPGTSVNAIHQYGRQLIAQGKKEEALKIFKHNAQVNKGMWPVNYGLARGYSAVGNYKEAVKYLELALKDVPAGDTVNPPVMKANIEKLKRGEDIN